MINNERDAIIFDFIGAGANRELDLSTAEGFHKTLEWSSTQDWFGDFCDKQYPGLGVVEITTTYFHTNDYSEFSDRLVAYIKESKTPEA